MIVWLFENWKRHQIPYKAAVTAALGFLLIAVFGSIQPINASLVTTEASQFCDLQPIIENVIGISVRLAGIMLFIMLVAGGFLYLSSGGEPTNLEQAKKTISYAIFGIAFLAGSWIALNFIKTFTGVNVTSFIIPCEQ